MPSWLGMHNTPTASLQRGKTPPTSDMNMTLDNLMVSFGEGKAPFHCVCSQVHSETYKVLLLQAYLLVK